MDSARIVRATGHATADEHEALLQLTQALFCSLEFTGQIKSVSRTWCEKIGIPEDESVGAHFLHFVHHEDAELCQDEFQRLLTGNPPRDYAIRLNCADGSICWMNLHPSVNRDAERIYILGTDITVDRMSEQGLPDPSLLLDQVGQGVFVADAMQYGTPIIYANLEFERVTGYRAAEVHGKPFHFLTGSGTLAATIEALEQAMLQTETVTLEILHYHKDGSAFWNQLTVSPVINSQGQTTHFIAVMDDSTDHRLIAEALREKNQNLANALSDLEKTKDVVIQRERMHALGQMASGIAHDFNNLLAPVLGFSELLINMPEYLRDENRARGYLEKIRNSAQEGAAVVGRMREFYRSHDAEEDMVPLDPAEIAKEAIELTVHRWRNQAEAHGIQIEMDSRIDPVPNVLGTASDLRQALTNLILNSVDAMPEGGRIEVRCSTDDSWVSLEVSDSGIGMDEETRKRCLEPFYTTKGKAGTGLGLSIIFGVIQRHNGRMEIESTSGKGAKITLHLPVCFQSDPQPTPVVETGEGKPMRILLIDDEDLLLEVVSEHLTNMGHNVSCHIDPGKALEDAYKHEFDLVITDRAMPGMTGDKVAKSVKAYRPDLPIVMLTGFGDIMRQTGEQPENIDLVLSKPVSVQTIRNTVAQFAAN